MAARRSLRSLLRRTIGVWVVLALVVSAVAISRMGSNGSTGSDETSRGDTSTASGSAGSSSRPDGPSTTEPGILLVVNADANAALDVTEVVLLSKPTRSITLRPPDFSAVGTIFDAEKKPYASKVRIVAGNQPVPVPEGLVNRAQTLTLDEPTRSFEIRYELNRAVVFSRPSTAGRALGAVRPLTGKLPDSLTTTVVAVGGSVRNLSCPELPLARQACATGKPPLLRLREGLPWRTAVVLLQLDLSAGR